MNGGARRCPETRAGLVRRDRRSDECDRVHGALRRAGTPVPDAPVTRGLYLPTDNPGDDDSFPAPAPAGGYGTSLGVSIGNDHVRPGRASKAFEIQLIDDAVTEPVTESVPITLRNARGDTSL
jgi:hypothetical protein